MRLKTLLDHRYLVAILAVLLSVMLLLVSRSSPPTVPIRLVPTFEDGSIVHLIGVIVDMSLRDGGAEVLVIADISEGTTLRVYCDHGLNEQPSRFLSVGDEVRVHGEVSTLGSSPILFTTSDGIFLSRKSESVLSMDALYRNWAILEGDSFRMSGLVINGGESGSYRLSDPKVQQSILLRPDHLDLASQVGKKVTLTVVLRLDQETMSLVLIASSFSLGQS